MIQGLHYLNGPRLWEYWYIPLWVMQDLYHQPAYYQLIRRTSQHHSVMQILDIYIYKDYKRELPIYPVPILTTSLNSESTTAKNLKQHYQQPQTTPTPLWKTESKHHSVRQLVLIREARPVHLFTWASLSLIGLLRSGGKLYHNYNKEPGSLYWVLVKELSLSYQNGDL